MGAGGEGPPARSIRSFLQLFEVAKTGASGAKILFRHAEERRTPHGGSPVLIAPPGADAATAAAGQPLALADHNAGREGLAATRSWLAKRDWGIVNPSGTASPCHLPLHRGGLGRCVRRQRSNSAARRAAASRPYGAAGATYSLFTLHYSIFTIHLCLGSFPAGALAAVVTARGGGG